MRGLASLAAFPPGLLLGKQGIDPVALNLNFRVAAGATFQADNGAGRCVWTGQGSAGQSGLRSMFHGPNEFVNGPVVNGKQAANSPVQGRQLILGTPPAYALPNITCAQVFTPPAGPTAAFGSMWALVRPTSFDGSTFDGVLGSAGTFNFLFGASSQLGAPNWYLHIGSLEWSCATSAVAGAYVLVQARFTTNLRQIRTNKNAWVSAPITVPSGAMTETFCMGVGNSGGMKGDWVDLAATPDFYDDATFNGIYDTLKALYPATGI